MDTVEQTKLLVKEMSDEERIRYLQELLQDHGLWSCDNTGKYITVCELCIKLVTNYNWIESECSAGGTCPYCERMTCENCERHCQRCERKTCGDCKVLRRCCDDCEKTGRREKCDKRRRKGRKVYKGALVCRECLAETCPYCPPPS